MKWPPENTEEWSAYIDYFTLIQWDVVNTALVSHMTSLTEPGAVIRSSESELFTPAVIPADHPELGLHTSGHGSERIFFDNFAVRARVSSTGSSGFSGAVQE